MKVIITPTFEKSLKRLFSNNPYYIMLRFFNNIMYIPKDLKSFFQRRIKGYSFKDLWNANDYLGKHIIKVLKDFKKINVNSYPCYYNSIEEWHKEIDNAIEGFEMLITDSIDLECFENFEKNKISKKQWLKEEEEYYKKAKDKAKKLIDIFLNLWD